MANNKIPDWAVVALIAVLFVSIGINGTLLLQDRNNITKVFEAQERILNEIKVVQSSQTKTINYQNRIIDRICGLLPLDYKQRTDNLRSFPLSRTEDVK